MIYIRGNFDNLKLYYIYINIDLKKFINNLIKLNKFRCAACIFFGRKRLHRRVA